MSLSWNAIILAGDRGLTDPVATAAGVHGKAFAQLNGKTLLEKVIAALKESRYVNQIICVGPDKKYLHHYPNVVSSIERNHVQLLAPASGPSASAISGVLSANSYPCLVITCDLALINPKIIDEYCEAMNHVSADFAACSIDYLHIKQKIPQLKKTQYKFMNTTVCFANVFAVLSTTGIKALEYWQDIEKNRKNPIQLISKIDWFSLIKYKLNKLTLGQVANKLSDKVGAELIVEPMLNPELAIDIDSEEDYQIIQQYLQREPLT